MRFLIDGKVVEAKGIYIGGKLIKGEKGAFAKYVRNEHRKLIKDFTKGFKEILDPM